MEEEEYEGRGQNGQQKKSVLFKALWKNVKYYDMTEVLTLYL